MVNPQPFESMPSGALANFSAIASEDFGLSPAALTESSGGGQLPRDRFNAPVYGTSKGDRLYGDADPSGFNDILFGEGGKDRIRGRAGNDVLLGGEGEDRLRGDSGSDVLWGGSGDDRLTGDGAKHKGQDVFVLATNSGTDRILDFQVGTDRLGLTDGLTVAQLEFSQSGKDAVIVDRASGDALARLHKVDAAALGEDAFISGQPVSGQPVSPEPVAQDSAPPAPDPGPAARPAPASAEAWAGDFSGDWEAQWDLRQKGAWGEDNFEVLSREGGLSVLRVHYPKDSAAPSVSRKTGVPVGGGQFYADLDLPPQDSLRLSYDLKFSDDFEFVKGGKLPGLFGGTGASGGNIPDGTDGFSTRLMWRQGGEGEVYAYLPTSKGYGTSIGRGAWTFTPGQWHTVEQEVSLNQPGQSDGQVKVWLDGDLVLQESGLKFRTTDKLKLDGIFFSTFFGGGDRSWSTPKAAHADFANFSVSPAKGSRA